MKFQGGLIVILCSMLSSQCFAGAAQGTGSLPAYNATEVTSSNNDTQAFVGLGWSFGGKGGLELSIGVRSVSVTPSGNVYGSNVSASMDLSGIDSAKIKARYVDGTTNGQGEIGFGYAFGPGKFLGTAGYSLPYVYVGTDYLMGSGLDPFLSLNALDKLKKPNPSYACRGVPATLNGTLCQP